MKPKDLVSNIRQAYIKARNPIVDQSNIKRGTSRTISSITEDLVAEYVASKINKKFEVWVDPQIIVKDLKNSSGKKSLLFRPDISIFNISSKKIVKIFDIKMDLGYKRNEFIDLAKKRKNQLKKIVNHTGSCSLRENERLYFDKNLLWDYIIISKGNMSKNQYEKIETYFNKNNLGALFSFVLNGHLNSYNYDYVPIINVRDFNKLNKELKALAKRF